MLKVFPQLADARIEFAWAMSKAGAGTAALATFTTAGRALVDDADATAQRTTLGLGTIATQGAGAVAITGGTITATGAGDTDPSNNTTRLVIDVLDRNDY